MLPLHQAGLIKNCSHMPDNPISIMKLLWVGVRARILCGFSLVTRYLMKQTEAEGSAIE